MARRTTPALLAAALSLFAAGRAAAQIVRFPARQNPSAWLSLSAGIMQFGDVVDDGTTASQWNFSSTVQYRASLEREHGNNSSYGLVGTYARPSLDYRQVAGGQARIVDGSATVSSLAALFRAGGGAGLHQIIEVSVGARRYSGFRADDTDEELAPADGDVDLTGSVGFGFGFPLGQRAALTLVQDADFTYHQRERTAGVDFDGGFHRTYVTRLGIRYGFGNRSRLR